MEKRPLRDSFKDRGITHTLVLSSDYVAMYEHRNIYDNLVGFDVFARDRVISKIDEVYEKYLYPSDHDFVSHNNARTFKASMWDDFEETDTAIFYFKKLNEQLEDVDSKFSFD